MSQKRREAIANICDRRGVALCYLFGSQAEGFAHARSDVDIAVVFRSRLSGDALFLRESIIVEELQAIFPGSEVQLVTLPVEDAALNFAVVAKGELLFAPADLDRARFEEHVWRDWHDWEPFAIAFGRELSNAIHDQYAHVR